MMFFAKYFATLIIVPNIYYFCDLKFYDRMNIEFADKGLEDLYLYEVTKEKKYQKLSKNIIKRYIKAVNYLKAVRRIEDLYSIKSLHYEKKKGNLKGVEAVWVNDQYRLFFESSSDEQNIVVNALLLEISKHYE